jgi:hypothetical protein
MTTSYNWVEFPATKEMYLDVPEGQYVIKKHGPRLYRAFFNDKPTQFAGHKVEGVMEQVIENLRSASLPKVHSQNGFSV